MRINFIIVTFLSICLALVACTADDVLGVADKNNITLVVSSSSLETKGIDGEENLNENKIYSLHYFLYPSGKTDEEPVVSGVVRPKNAVSESLTISLDIDEATLRTRLFPNNNRRCDVYIIANLPDVELPEPCTIEELKELSLSAEFLGPESEGYFKLQDSFVMDGQGFAEIISLKNVIAAKGDINLSRIASKMTLGITIADSYEDSGNNIWTPDISSLRVELKNCASNTFLSCIPEGINPGLFNYGSRVSNRNVDVDIDGTTKTRYLFQPFYSYPYRWETRSENELTFYIVLRWEKQDGRGQLCYYKVLLNTNELVRNTHYHINLHIGILGSFDQYEDPVEIEQLQYSVIDWTNGLDNYSGGVEADTEILAAHYLVLENNNYVMNNTAELLIPYKSSHFPCQIANTIENNITKTYIKRENYSDNANYDSDGAMPLSIDLVKIGQENYIRVSHELINDLNNTNVDYLPYTITFRIRHQDNPNKYFEDVTVVQYPANYITREQNSYYDSSNPTADKAGSVYVNGDGPDRNGNGAYGGCYGIYGGNTNSNPNRYIIKTTVLGTDHYIIGDPRNDNINNIPNNNGRNWSATAADMYGENDRQIGYYYPTDKSSDTQNMISPEFMIASSYGVTDNGSYDNMRRRCASYQEDGYPAGRWRMPTMAELEYIITLSAKGVIPRLFNNDSEYWCAHGTVKPNNDGTVTPNTNTSGSHSVRCVYDTWYWTDRLTNDPNTPQTDERAVFTWGDKQR